MKHNYLSSKLVVYFLIFIALFMLMLGGCSNEEPANVNTDEGNSETAPQSTEETSEDSKNGGTIKIGLSPGTGDIKNLGYAGSYRGAAEMFVAVTSLETLVSLNESGEVDPLLAKSWETDAENLTVTFNLREGVKFHDGTDFNAEAVKWNIDETIKSNSVEFADVESVEVVDNYTVRINLKKWNNSLLGAFATYMTIFSPTAAQENGGKDWMMKNPVGTGPFKFVSLENDVSVKFEKFEDYWQEGKPYLDTVEFYNYQDEMSLEASFQANEIDVVYSPSLKAAGNLESSGRIAELTSGIGSRLTGIMTSSSNPESPFNDVRVRRALGYAIDVKPLMNAVTFGYAVDTNQYGSSNYWSYNPNVEGTPYDPEKAKKLLAEAGYPNGFKTTLYTVSSYADAVTAIQSYLAEIGIEANIDVTDPARYDQLVSPDGGWDGIILFMLRAEPDVALFMPRYFSEAATRYGKHILHPDNVKSLFNEVMLAPDQAAKKEIAHKLQKAVFDEHVLATPFWLELKASVLKESVQDSGINETHATGWTPAEVWLQK
ncbi:ABC transporter substrate-binding protein [Bacillus sp. Marseille-P3661]|uniref:ABC transporter substrate-binding protein n=1 Tax=Bacillus sp. Marseille-P3661 TaxID=1936234 RepID=UPI000C863A86|nr:ABC transporter substrate-binding protein [Bacillus sp. Marseille-P3661]